MEEQRSLAAANELAPVESLCLLSQKATIRPTNALQNHGFSSSSSNIGHRQSLLSGCCSINQPCKQHYDYHQLIVKDSFPPVWDAAATTTTTTHTVTQQQPLSSSFVHHHAELAAPNSCNSQLQPAFGSLASQDSGFKLYPGNSDRTTLPQLTSHGMYRPTDMLGNKWDVYRDHELNDLCYAEKLKARIVAHPLYEQMLAAHVACLRVGTPVDHYHNIDASLANRQHIAARYLMMGRNDETAANDKDDLDHFMVSYILLLQSFKEQLQEHLSIHASQAISGCFEIEQALYSLTGATIEAGNGAMMPEDENAIEERNHFFYNDSRTLARLGLDSFLPTDAERTLLEHIRRELKHELKHNYLTKLKDVREEILRKRRAGKLPGDTTNILKDWWNTHAKWPYPTEEEKQRMVEETGLDLKQINNWFINQRKRNWQTQSSPSSLASGDVTTFENDGVDVSLSLNADMQENPNKRYMQHEGSSSWSYQPLHEE